MRPREVPLLAASLHRLSDFRLSEDAPPSENVAFALEVTGARSSLSRRV